MADGLEFSDERIGKGSVVDGDDVVPRVAEAAEESHQIGRNAPALIDRDIAP